MLNRLVEKGKNINPEEIIKIYGENERNSAGREGKFDEKRYLNTDYKYNNTDSNFNLLGKMGNVEDEN